jgi:lantibiotic leader peptide-processing serine protease
MKKARTVAVVLLVAACSETPAPVPTAPEARFSVSGQTPRYVVVFKGQGLPRDVDRIVADAGGAVSTSIPEIGAIEATSGDRDFATRIARDHQVQAVSPNIELQMIPPNPGVELVAVADATGTQGPSEPPGPDPQPGPLTEPLYFQQWDKMRMNASAIGSYAVQLGRRDVIVAILDTGVELTHPDILPNLDVGRSRSFVPDEPSIDDENGHGSWCASAVAAPINGIGISGVAPGVTLVALKVLRRTGGGNLFWLAQALVYAGQQKFDVASMSLAGILRHAGHYEALTQVVQRAVDFARANGVTPIAALGNELYDVSDGNFFRDFFVYPAELPGVIGVSATGYNNQKSWYSNYGMGKTDISAPGGDFPFQPPPPAYHGSGNVLGAWAPENLGAITPVMREEQCTPTNVCSYYAWIQGTSMATPNAAGVAALIISQYGDFTPDNSRKVHMSPTKVESILQRTANNRPCPEPNSQTYNFRPPPPEQPFSITSTCKGEAGGYTNYFGKGIVDALKAVTEGPGSGAADYPVASERK